MHRNEYRRMAHEEVEEIFREILPQAGMKVREEQIVIQQIKHCLFRHIKTGLL